MSGRDTCTRTWVVLTMGDRPDAVDRALSSIAAADPAADIMLVVNGDTAPERLAVDGVDVVVTGRNLGVPGGRDLAVRRCRSELVVFLDDDAVVMTEHIGAVLSRRFSDATVAAMSFRLIDEESSTSRRHNPRIGRRGTDMEGHVTTFLGGACALRRSSYVLVGGYWPALFYAHEELDLSWRLIDAGLDVVYDPAVEIFHPRTEISRHASGWELTGRNRVLVARRNLPVPILVLHTLAWLLLGVMRAPDRSCRMGYLRGWSAGWLGRPVQRRPIRWATVAKLTRLGRPPVI